ncbi:unnamed protein product, partial [Phaeothamnion confervicola]
GRKASTTAVSAVAARRGPSRNGKGAWYDSSESPATATAGSLWPAAASASPPREPSPVGGGTAASERIVWVSPPNPYSRKNVPALRIPAWAAEAAVAATAVGGSRGGETAMVPAPQ